MMASPEGSYGALHAPRLPGRFAKSSRRGVASLHRPLSRQEESEAPEGEVEKPEPTKTKPLPIEISLGPTSAVVFKTQAATVGEFEVFFTGRLGFSGKASLIGEELPAGRQRAKIAALRNRVRELMAAELSATTPKGDSSAIEVTLGGEVLRLELGGGAVRAPDFQVSGRFELKEQKRLASTSYELDAIPTKRRRQINPGLTLDATAWLKPKPKPPPEWAQPEPADKKDDASDSSVVRYSFGGVDARFADEGRSGTVVSKAAMDTFESSKLPDFVKTSKFLRLPEQRMAFFQEMRAYFGTDEKTIEHFSKLRQAKVKGARTWLHDEAATRLEQVQAEIGENRMPKSGGVGWPRAECTLAGKQDLGNLHNLGFAVDYNAYQTPHIKDRRLLDLISVVTGRSPSADYSAPRGVDQRKLGEAVTSGTAEEKAKAESDENVRKWLDEVAKEAKSLSDASEKFRGSLDDPAALLRLRDEWFAAKTDAEKQAVAAKLPKAVRAWRRMLLLDYMKMVFELVKEGIDPATLPSGKDVSPAITAAGKLSADMRRFSGRIKGKLGKAQRKQLDKLCDRARKVTTDTSSQPASDADALAEFARLAGSVSTRSTALKQKRWMDRLQTVHLALEDPSFVFGKAKKKVGDPGAAQLVDTGFFNLRGSAKAGPEAFGTDFVRSMVKHGFGHGATWSTPDYMHFELRWKGPAQ